MSTLSIDCRRDIGSVRQNDAPRCHSDQNIVAVVTNDGIECAVPCFRPGDVDGLCRFLVQRLGLVGPGNVET
jgi:hypothetical protein